MTSLREKYKIFKNSRSFFYVKIGVSAVLVACILYRCDWKLTLSTFMAIEPKFLVLVFFCMVGGVIISAFKWQVLLSVHDAHIPLSTLNRYYFIAVFFNNFLPSSIGGDGFRIYKTASEVVSKGHAVVAVLMERVSGLWALLFLGYIGGLFVGPGSSGIPYFRQFLWVIGSALVLSGLFFVVTYFISDRYKDGSRFPVWLTTLFGWIHDYRRHPGKTINVVALSFFFQLYALSWMLLLSRAVGADISIFMLAVAMMISNLAALLPISLNGLGLMDGSFIYIASSMGMEYEHGVMMMLIMRVFLVFLSLIGSYFYLRLKSQKVS